jgi:hypothetical protein
LYPAFHAEDVRPFLHPSLDRESLFAYLFEVHIYPAKRVDYLGNPVVLPPAVNDEDWVGNVKVEEHKTDMAGSY